MFEFRLPDIGEGVAEGEIVKWHVVVGDTISSDQDMVEIMTDKVTVRIPSPVSGKVSEILAAEGKVAKVGDLLIKIDDGKPEITSNISAATAEKASVEKPHEVQQTAAEKPVAQRSIATPAIRKAAKDMGIDIESVTPSGEGGRITMKDLENFASASRASSETPRQEKKAEKQATEVHKSVLELRPGMEEQYEPKGLRRIIFEKMSKSKATIPHFMIGEEIDFTKLRDTREDLKSRDQNVTFTPIFVKALTLALKEFPRFNAVYDEKSRSYSIKKYYNIGVAVDTPDGLNVVVVKDADRKNVFAISSEIASLADKARSGKLALQDVQDSTFTISNVGTIGGIFSTPIINYPEVAIIAFHRTLVDEKNPAGKEKMYITLSCDHRLIDGADAARFISRVKGLLEKPSLIFVD